MRHANRVINDAENRRRENEMQQFGWKNGGKNKKNKKNLGNKGNGLVSTNPDMYGVRFEDPATGLQPIDMMSYDARTGLQHPPYYFPSAHLTKPLGAQDRHCSKYHKGEFGAGLEKDEPPWNNDISPERLDPRDYNKYY
ncbi:MAG: hypothetical protein EZS28_050188 [Streblomastix strix]|uniref:Uncharacterized protein n=1 Tax=Streblomastix strix TaxID=222440 RepID=A0A5J4T772_9EUKA|nr:MAG: hypothetical protein EZS28_050188 [Streblomastix strix]